MKKKGQPIEFHGFLYHDKIIIIQKKTSGPWQDLNLENKTSDEQQHMTYHTVSLFI